MSTFFQMRKVDEHLLSSWASRMLSKVDEHKFLSKPGRFYIWNYLNTVATGAQSWAQLSKRVVHFLQLSRKGMKLFSSDEQDEMSTFFRWARTNEHFLFAGEHFLFLSWAPVATLPTPQHSDDRCWSLDEQGGWALFLQLSNKGEHLFQVSKLRWAHSSEEQDKKSTFF